MFATNWLRRFRLSRTAGIASLTLAALLSTAPGCKEKDKDAAKSEDKKAAGATTTVGFIYVGTKTDYGYNQAMADGAAAVKTMPGITVVEQENVPETKNCQQAMSTMIDNDATLIFATSYGYFDPHVKQIAPQQPK